MSLVIDLKRVRKKFGERAEKVAKGTFLSLAGRIVKATPVGRPELWSTSAPEGYIGGTLRGAWNISLGSPDVTFTGKPDKQGDATIGRLNAEAAKLKLGQSWWMTNPAPYAARIEYEGWSSQAPAGMMRVNIMQTQAVVNEQLKK